MADTKSYISKITLPSGNTYHLKDSRIDGIQIVKLIGITTDNLTDGCVKNPINIVIDSFYKKTKEVTAENGDIVLKRTVQDTKITTQEYREPIPEGQTRPNISTPESPNAHSGDMNVTVSSNSYTDTETNEYVTVYTFKTTYYNTSEEYIFSNGYWYLLGSVDSKNLGEFAYINQAYVTIPQITDIGITGTKPEQNATVSDYTPSGEISKPEITVTPTTSNINIAMTVSDETLSFSFSQGGESVTAINVDAITEIEAESSVPEFTGNKADIEVTYTAWDEIYAVPNTREKTYSVYPNDGEDFS